MLLFRKNGGIFSGYLLGHYKTGFFGHFYAFWIFPEWNFLGVAKISNIVFGMSDIFFSGMVNSRCMAQKAT